MARILQAMEVDGLVSAALEVQAPQLREVLAGLFAEVGPERGLELLEGAAPGWSSTTLARVAQVVSTAHDLETLTRPLLETLQGLSGLASTYLTVVHLDADEQEVRYSLNASTTFVVPEGIRVPWADTLCQRALAEGRPCSTDVAVVWADSQAARDLGIQTYVSVPVRLADGSLWGTLCGADDRVVEEAEKHLPTLVMFARLIAAEVERAAVLAEAQRQVALDPLTGCASRRGIDLWLERARLSGTGAVAAAWIDLDAFKQVNDTYGHPAGDQVLAEVGQLLRSQSREGDLVGRLGGDEFVVAAELAPEQVAGFLARWGSGLDLVVQLPDTALPVSASVGTALVPPERVGDLLAQADQAMYDVKRARVRARRQSP